MSAPTPAPDPSDPTRPELGGLNPRDLIAGGLQSAVPRPQGWQPPEPEVLAHLLPQYQIEAFLGRGGMGAVYRGRQIALDRAIALKLLPAELTADAEFVGRFQREARTLARLQHPGIVAIYDFGQTSEGHLYFVMEYVDGTDLHRIIHGPGVNPAQALEIVGQVCEALQYAHTHGVMHRDIKPANVLVTQDGRAKLADFGLARPTHDDSGGFTRSNVVMGTPDYIAPEQMYGQADHRADLFSLGVMLYEMLTGQTPRGAWAPPSQRVRVDVRLDQVVIRALQHDVAMRYQQASEMKIDVDTIRTTPLPVATQAKKPQTPSPQKPAAKAAPAPERIQPIRRKRTFNSWMLAVALPLLAVGFGYWAISQPESDAAKEPAPSAAEPSKTDTVSSAPAAAAAAAIPPPLSVGDSAVPKWQAVHLTEESMRAKGLTAAAEGWIDFGEKKGSPNPQNQWSQPHPGKGFTHVAIRARYRWPASGGSLSLFARAGVGEVGRPTLILWGNDIKLEIRDLPKGSPNASPPAAKPPAQLKGGQEGTLELAAIGNRVLARLDGKLMFDVVEPRLAQSGLLEWRSARCWLRDLEYLDLAGVADPLKALGWDVPVSPVASAQAVARAQAPASPAATFQPVPNLLERARAKSISVAGDTITLNREPDFVLGITPRNFALRIPYEADRFRYLQVSFRLAAGGVCDRVTLNEKEMVLAARREPVQRFPRQRPTPPREEGVLEIAAIDGLLIARLSTGEVFTRAIDPAGLKGDLQVGGSEGTKIRDVRYRDLDGEAEPLKTLGWEVPPTPAAPTALPVPSQWIDQTAEVMAAATKNSRAEAVPGGWRPIGTKMTGAGFGPKVENGVIRFQHRGAAGAAARLTVGKSYVATVDAKVTLKFSDSSTTPGTEITLAENVLPASLKLADSHLTTFAFEGNRLRLWVDDALVAEASDTNLHSGGLLVRAHTGSLIEKVEYGLLPGISAQDKPEIATTKVPAPAASAPSPAPASPSVASAAAPPAPVPAPMSDLEARLADIHAKFQAAYDRDIAPPHAATVATLDSNYLAAVNRALDAATKRGDLDEAVQVRAEAKRVTEKQPMPVEDAETTPAILKTLRATYRTTLASLEKERDAKAKPYFDRYDNLLEDYQKELTQRGRLDDALLVKTRRDELRDRGAASPPTQAQSPSVHNVAAAPAVPATPDAASQDKLLDWVFDRKGEVTLRAGAQFSKAKNRNQLPNSPYEIHEIQVTGPGIGDRELALISAAPSLRVVRLIGKNEFKTLKPFATLTSLGQLSIQGTPIKEAELAHLAGLTALDSVYLEFIECTGEGFTALHAHDKLKSINLINVDLSEAGARAIAGISPLSNLTLDRFVQRKSQVHLAALAALPNLTRFSLTHSRIGEEAFKAIASLKSLTHLNLSDSELYNPGFAHLAPLGPTLTSLDMQYSATASDEGIRHVAANLTNLDTITVSTGATCTGDSIRALAKLPKLKNLSWWVKGMKNKDYQLLADLPAIERITLNTTEITDDGLSAFPKSNTLVFLNLDNNAITDKGLAHLQAIPNLKEVVLKSTKVTDAGFAAFQKTRPGVKVTK